MRYGGYKMDNKKKKEMEESEEKYKILFNSNPEALLYVDKDFKIVDINPRFEELFGYSIDEIRGKDINEFIVPKNRRDEGQKLDKKSKEGYTFYETVRNFVVIYHGVSPTSFVCYMD